MQVDEWKTLEDLKMIWHATCQNYLRPSECKLPDSEKSLFWA